MQTILAIETSVPEASVALVRDGVRVFSEDFLNGRNHNSQIFDALEKVAQLLQGEDFEGKGLDAVLVGTGPGSYSGVRVAIAAAQGMAIVHGCDAIGLASLGATSVARESDVSLAIGDARRGLYYTAEIAASGEAQEAELMEIGEFHERLAKAHAAGVSLFTMDDPESLALGEDLQHQVSRGRPEAAHLIEIWQALEGSRREELRKTPLAPAYLRPPFTSKAKQGHPLIRKS